MKNTNSKNILPKSKVILIPVQVVRVPYYETDHKGKKHKIGHYRSDGTIDPNRLSYEK
jgi:hypothetical protein